MNADQLPPRQGRSKKRERKPPRRRGPLSLLMYLYGRVFDRGATTGQRILFATGSAAGTATLGCSMIIVYLMIMVPFTPSKSNIRGALSHAPTIVLSADGVELDRYQRQQRTWVPYEDISPNLIDALVATEDHRYYRHRGVDLRRLVTSVGHTIIGDPQGGSTITMQLARNLYPERIGDAFVLNRKCKELVTARKLESVYSKEEILELYLNNVSYIYNVRGIGLAAQTYFGKSAKELTISESATLVGMLKATSYYNPVRHPERARHRRNVVLAQMVKRGRLDETRFDELKEQPVRLKFQRPKLRSDKAPYFTDHVHQWLEAWADDHGYDLYADGLVVRTTLDWRIQQLAAAAVRRQGDALQTVANVEWSRSSSKLIGRDFGPYHRLKAKTRPFAHFWANEKVTVDAFVRETKRHRALVEGGLDTQEAIDHLRSDQTFMDSLRIEKTRLQMGLVSIDPRTGHVKAWVGGRDHVRAPFDHVGTARRQPGSTFKPFLYAAALESGYRPDDWIADETVEIPLGGDDVWRLASTASEEDSHVTLREALARSKNNVAAHLIKELGPKSTARIAKRMGIRESRLRPVPSLALGTSPVTLLEMTSAYATLAAKGVYREPLVVTEIADRDGNIVEQFTSEENQALAEKSAVELTDMMRSVIDEGTGVRIRQQFGIRADVAGKTGTTQNNVDGWFLLMHPHLVSGAWVGFDDQRVTFRSDFWGEGAHNALFVVGDLYRAALRQGRLNSRVQFDTPERRRVFYIADGDSWWRTRVNDVGEWFARTGESRNTDPVRRSRTNTHAPRHPPAPRKTQPTTRQERREIERRVAILKERLRDYEKLKKELERSVDRILDDDDERTRLQRRILKAYLEERERNEQLQELEREVDRRLRAWARQLEESR